MAFELITARRADPSNRISDVGVVVIGKNVAEHLRSSLEPALQSTSAVVYVDSGSVDGSIETARRIGVEIVEIDQSEPFTTARARNAGARRLHQLYPELDYVQFVDGDCELVDGWLSRAATELDANPHAVAIWGQRRERNPSGSIYNRLCELEWNWDLPYGEVPTLASDVMIRVKALRQLGGYNPEILRGAARDLAVRLRRQGWVILRLRGDMTVHDAAMTRLGQWLARTVRTGHAYAEGCWRHGRGPTRDWVRETASLLAWGLLLPALILAGAALIGPEACWLGIAYPVQGRRIYRTMRKREFRRSDSAIYAIAVLAGKLPMALGAVLFGYRLLSGKRSSFIEYN